MTPEGEIVRRAQGGDSHAWGAIVEAHQASLHRLVAAILRHEEDARDVCQDAFRQAFLNLHDFDAGGRIGLWLRRIAINLSRDLLRKRKVRQANPEELSPLPVGSPDPSTILSGRESRDRILHAIERLPLEFREVLVSHLLEERPYAELAQMLDLTVNAVRIRVHRGLARLRELVKEDIS